MVALAAVFWIYFKILRIAKVKNLVDQPNARKLQQIPIPVLGGIAVFFGIVLATLVAGTMMDCGELLPLLAAMVVMLYMGAMDDVIGLSPGTRLVAETLAILGLIYGGSGCISSLHGLWGVGDFSWWIAVPLTVFAGVGIINAMNMIDGINGLSCGVCSMCAILFGCVFAKNGDLVSAIMSFAVVAALFPFLLHNVFGGTSRMFIGDAGTMVMGLLMAWCVIRLLSPSDTIIQPEQETAPVAQALAILALPVFDALRVMTLRMLHGRSPFSADKTHLHHAFVGLGVSHSATALSEVTIGMLVWGIWRIVAAMGASADVQLYTVILAAVVLVWGTYALLAAEHTRSPFVRWVAQASPSTHWGHTGWWLSLQKWLDAPEFRSLSGTEEDTFVPRKRRKFFNQNPVGKK